MKASDADDKDRQGARRRGGRDVLDIGGGGRGGRRQPRNDRDDDDDGDDANDRDRKGDEDEDDAPGRNGDGSKGKSKDKGKGDKNGKDKGDKDKDDEDKEESDEEAQAKRKKRRPIIIAIAVIVVLLLAGYGVYYWLSHRDLADTDDAYTDGNVVSIAPQVSGEVVSLDVTDNQFVHKGDPLIHIDPRQYVYSREQAQGTLDSTDAQVASQKLGVEIARKNFPASLQLAQANLESAKANLALQKFNYDRQKSLPKQATTQQEVDTATANYQQAQAQVDQAQARVVQAEPVQQNIGQSEDQVGQIQGQLEQAQGRLDQAKLNVEWTVLRAPQDGYVTRRNVNQGNYIQAGTQIMALVTPDVWVTANFKETQLDRMRPGQRVTISVDAYPDLDLRGHVDSIQHGSGSRFSAFPAENATGNFIKIVQRVPVKIVIDSGLDPKEPLPLGISVEPTVTLK